IPFWYFSQTIPTNRMVFRCRRPPHKIIWVYSGWHCVFRSPGNQRDQMTDDLHRRDAAPAVSSRSLKNSDEAHAEDKSPVLEQIVPFGFGKHYLYAWTAIFLVFLGASVAFASTMREQASYLGFCVPLTASFIMIPLAFRFCYQRLIAWSQFTPTFAKHKEGELSAD